MVGLGIIKANGISGEQIDVWNGFVTRHPWGEIYHTSYWQNVIADSFYYEPFYLVKRNGAGEIKCGIPVFKITGPLMQNRLCVVPGAQCCDPLVGNQQDYDEMVEYLIGFTGKYNFKYLELRISHHFAFDTHKFGHKITEYSTYVLNIDQEIENLTKVFHKNCIQRPLKKALQYDLEIQIGRSKAEVREFYKLYLVMRKNKGLLPQPFRFFESLCNELGAKNLLDVYLCVHDGKVISGIILLKFKDKVIYEYGASLPGAFKYNASHFLLWHAIVNARKNGFKKFDFGRTGDDNPSLATFKSRWGAEKLRLFYYFVPETQVSDSIRQKSSLKKLMNYTVINSPLSFSRLAGSVLYRYLI